MGVRSLRKLQAALSHAPSGALRKADRLAARIGAVPPALLALLRRSLAVHGRCWTTAARGGGRRLVRRRTRWRWRGRFAWQAAGGQARLAQRHKRTVRLNDSWGVLCISGACARTPPHSGSAAAQARHRWPPLHGHPWHCTMPAPKHPMRTVRTCKLGLGLVPLPPPFPGAVADAPDWLTLGCGTSHLPTALARSAPDGPHRRRQWHSSHPQLTAACRMEGIAAGGSTSPSRRL